MPDCNFSPTNIARRAFSFVAPTIWNSLPIPLRSLATASTPATFIKHLKYYLFSLAYPCHHVTLSAHTIRLRDWHMARYKFMYLLTYWLVLTRTAVLWRVLFRHGSYWLVLAHSGSFRLVLARSGSYWLALACSGSFWLDVSRSCSFCLVLARSLVLVRSGSFWLVP